MAEARTVDSKACTKVETRDEESNSMRAPVWSSVSFGGHEGPHESKNDNAHLHNIECTHHTIHRQWAAPTLAHHGG